MMQLLIDGRAVDVGPETLGAALEAVRRHAPGRLVVEAMADGVLIPDDELLNPPGRSPYARTLEIRTESVAAMLRDAVLESASRLHASAEAAEQAARRVRRGELDVAVKALGELLPVWQDAQNVASTAGQMGFRLDDIERAVASLAGDLQALRACLAGQDWATLGDLLEGEMPEQARRWHGMMLELADRTA